MGREGGCGVTHWPGSSLGKKLFPARSSSWAQPPPSHFQHLRFPHAPEAGTQPHCLLLPSPHPSPASAPRKESSQLEQVRGATSSPGAEHPGTQHHRSQGTEKVPAHLPKQREDLT